MQARPLDHVDMASVAEQFGAFWRREAGPLVAIQCPAGEQVARDYPVPETVEGRWTDVAYQCDEALRRAHNTAFYGVAFPVATPNIGPDSFAAYLGGDLRFLDDTTSWVEPFVGDLADWEPSFRTQGRWWQHMCRLIDAYCEAAPGNFLVGIPDLHGGGDALAAARHPDRLALDLYDQPAEVQRVMHRLTAVYMQVFDRYYERTAQVQDGCTTWIPAYSRGPFTALQDDFSGLISPDMFARFFLPEIGELASYLDHSIYHLDGPSAVGNLPYLLEVNDLDGVQWVHGAGNGPITRWIDLCRQVLEGGKCLQIGCPAEHLEQMLSALPHSGLFITTGCGSEREAQELCRRIGI